MVHLFPFLLPFFLLFQPVLTDYTPFYSLFIHLNVPPIVCSMHPVSDSSHHCVTRRVTFSFYLFLAL